VTGPKSLFDIKQKVYTLSLFHTEISNAKVIFRHTPVD